MTGKHYHISQPLLPEFDGLVSELREVFESGQLTNGRHVKRLEDAVADYIEGVDAVALSSATTGLLLSWRAMDLTGEVLVPSFTFPATAHALVWNGLKPVFVDCRRDTFTIDIEDAKRKMTEKTVGMAPVYIFGTPPDWEALEEIMESRAIRCVADAAHGFGTRRDGMKAGGYGDVEIFSLAPTKVFTTGEGGIAVTRDGDLAEKLRRMRNYGNPGDYDCREAGLNGRMTEISALIGIHALPGHEAQLAHRQALAERYRSLLANLPGVSFQTVPDQVRSTMNYFAVLLEAGDFGLTNRELHEHLASMNVESKIYFHPPLHQQRLYRSLWTGEGLENTEWICERILCLPLTNRLDLDDVEWIAGCVRDAHEKAPSIRQAIG